MSTSEPERDYVALVHIQAVLQSRSDTQCAAVLDNPAWVNEIIAAIESRAIPIISVRARDAGDEAEAGPPHILRMQVQGIHRDDPQMIMQPEMRAHGTLDLNHAATRVYYEEQQLRDQVRLDIEPFIGQPDTPENRHTMQQLLEQTVSQTQSDADERDRIHNVTCPCGARHRLAYSAVFTCNVCERVLHLRTNARIPILTRCATCGHSHTVARQSAEHVATCPSCGEQGETIPAIELELHSAPPSQPRRLMLYLVGTQDMQFTAMPRNRDEQEMLVRQLNSNGSVVVDVSPSPTGAGAPCGQGTLTRIATPGDGPNLHTFGGELFDVPATHAMFMSLLPSLTSPSGVPNYQHHARPRPTVGQIVELEDGRRGVLQSERDQADGSSVANLRILSSAEATDPGQADPAPFAWAGFMPEVHTALTRLPEGPERTILMQHILTMVSDYRTIVKQLHNLRERHKQNPGDLYSGEPDTRIIELDPNPEV